MALLLDRRRLSIALCNDDAPQVGAVFAGNLLPCVFTFVLAEMDLASRLCWIEKNAPAVVRHFDVIEMRPARRLDADRGAQVHIEVLRIVGSHVAPPIQKRGPPLLKRALQG